MKTKHTEGEWNFHINQLDQIKIKSDVHVEGQSICRIHPCIERVANAKLIAAAPQLLKALQDMLNDFSAPNFKSVRDAEEAIRIATS